MERNILKMDGVSKLESKHKIDVGQNTEKSAEIGQIFV